jgi:hypothetical protein
VAQWFIQQWQSLSRHLIDLLSRDGLFCF